MKLKITLVSLVVIVLFVAGFEYVVRPWYLRWGATDAEISMSLPGDRYLHQPLAVSTRAITIQAPSAVVWAWLVQTGQGKGGFYSYTWLENLFGADMHNAAEIVPEYQQPKVGDWVLMHPLGATNKAMRAEIAFLDPGRAYVLSGGWGFYLREINANTTRLVVRYPNYEDPTYYYLVFEQAHFIMESGMMMGIKARAERTATTNAPVPAQAPVHAGEAYSNAVH